MRGLPAPPDDVALLELGFDIDGSFASIGFWIFVPGLTTLTVPNLQTLLGAFILDAEAFYTPITHEGCILVTCRLSTFGSQHVTLDETAPPSHGAWTGGQAAQVALGLSWKIGGPGRGVNPTTRVPGVPDAFTTDHARLNDLGFGNASSAAVDFLNLINAEPSPAGGNCLLGTLHRQHDRLPTTVATFAPFVAVAPVRHLATCRRRIQSFSQLTPS